MAAAQILAVTIFIVMFVLIVLDKIERHFVTLGCGVLTIVGVFGIIMRDTHAILETLNLHSMDFGMRLEVKERARPELTGRL